MKFCPKCGTSLSDDISFCPNCGTRMGASGGSMGAGPVQPYGGYIPADPYDHTSEFDPKDISDNKVVCMLIYLAGYLGILVALLLAGTSKYVAFHLRQALKIEVVTILLGLIAAVGMFLLFIPTVIAGALIAALFVVKIICFFQICNGKAKEPAIIRNLSFLK